jgi:hypothetical protein
MSTHSERHRHRIEPGEDSADVRGVGTEGRLTPAELHRAAAFAPPPSARLTGYPPASPELYATEPARSPARANRRAWGRARWSPPPAKTVPPIKGRPPRKFPPAERGPFLRLCWLGNCEQGVAKPAITMARLRSFERTAGPVAPWHRLRPSGEPCALSSVRGQALATLTSP